MMLFFLNGLVVTIGQASGCHVSAVAQAPTSVVDSESKPIWRRPHGGDLHDPSICGDVVEMVMMTTTGTNYGGTCPTTEYDTACGCLSSSGHVSSTVQYRTLKRYFIDMYGGCAVVCVT